jgi:hypothetical protein
MKIAIYLISVLLVFSCQFKEEKVLKDLINGKNDLWRVVLIGQDRNDSSRVFYRINSDNSFNEISFLRSGKFIQYDSNPDVIDWHKWKLINDSIFEFGYVKLRINSLTDSLALFGNIKRPQDSLRLLKVSIENGRFTNYR